MPNYVNDLVKGLNKGLAGLTEGFVQKRYRDNADELFKLGQTYLTEMGVKQEEYLKKADNLANPTVKENTVQKQTANIPFMNEYLKRVSEVTGMGTPEKMMQTALTTPGQVNKNYVKNAEQTLATKKRGLDEIYNNYLGVMGQLADNPYGKGKANVLEMIYKERNKDPEYKTFMDERNNTLITVGKDGKIVRTQKYAEDQPKEKKYKSLDAYTISDWSALENNPNDWSKISQNELIAYYGDLSKNAPKLKAWIDANYPQIAESYAQMMAEEQQKKKGRGGYRGGSIKFNPKETGYYNMAKQLYELQSVTSPDDKDLADIKELQNAFYDMGKDPEQAVNDYKNGKLNSRKEVQDVEQINDAFWQTYNDIGMERWWQDFMNSASPEEFNNKKAWYQNFIDTKIAPSITDPVYKKLISTFNKSLIDINNQMPWMRK